MVKTFQGPTMTSLLAEVDSQEKIGSGSTYLGLLEKQRVGDQVWEFLRIKALAQAYARLVSAITYQELC